MLSDLDRAVHWRELGGVHDVFGDGRVVLLPAPRHTPGTRLASDAYYD